MLVIFVVLYLGYRRKTNLKKKKKAATPTKKPDHSIHGYVLKRDFLRLSIKSVVTL